MFNPFKIIFLEEKMNKFFLLNYNLSDRDSELYSSGRGQVKLNKICFKNFLRIQKSFVTKVDTFFDRSQCNE